MKWRIVYLKSCSPRGILQITGRERQRSDVLLAPKKNPELLKAERLGFETGAPQSFHSILCRVQVTGNEGGILTSKITSSGIPECDPIVCCM